MDSMHGTADRAPVAGHCSGDDAMTTYTLHLPREARPGDPNGLDEADLVKDGFSWGAFFFTFLWFFVHRLWLAGFAVLVVLIAFGGILRLLGVAPFAAGVAHLLVLLL